MNDDSVIKKFIDDDELFSLAAETVSSFFLANSRMMIFGEDDKEGKEKEEEGREKIKKFRTELSQISEPGWIKGLEELSDEELYKRIIHKGYYIVIERLA